jgi:hypothetical protein
MLSFQNGIMSESHSGWLHKKTVGKWKPRFFNLSDGVMEMFASESMKMVLVRSRCALPKLASHHFPFVGFLPCA